MHEHHKVPRSAKGSDLPSNLVFLDPSCHNAVDRGAILVVKGKTGRAYNLVETYLSRSKAAQKRLLELINLQAKSWKTSEGRDEQPVIIKLQKGLYERLKLLASKHTNPGTKRTLGVGSYLAEILRQHVLSKSRTGECPLLTDETDDPAADDPNIWS
jgi:hypothetical protein